MYVSESTDNMFMLVLGMIFNHCVSAHERKRTSWRFIEREQGRLVSETLRFVLFYVKLFLFIHDNLALIMSPAECSH